ncbi:hypothetical protein [Luethyella okanaganae]|uniref:Amidase n=1 Tax=Luethyella okanaganae TaxID=69372 RepID=A0ABW1VDR0_9MICO
MPESYTEYLDPIALQGARIGYVPSMIGSNTTTVRFWEQAKATLVAHGATVVEVNPSADFFRALGESSGSTNEFKHDLNVYIANHLAQSTNLRLSPNTGMPAVTVPMGQSVAEDATIPGAAVNLEFLGRDYDEGTLIGLSYAFEQATHARTSPALYGSLD